MDPSNVPPPPGGYGLDPSPRGDEPQTADPLPPGPPPASPYRTNFAPPPPRPARKRWAFGGVGVAILAARLLVLCARAAAPDASYEYTPSSFSVPTFDPSLLAAPSALAPAPSPASQGGVVVAAPDGVAYFFDAQGNLQERTPGQTEPAVTLPAGTSEDDELAVTSRDVVYFVRTAEGRGLYARSRKDGATRALASQLDEPFDLAADEGAAYLHSRTITDDGVATYHVMRIPLAGGHPKVLAAREAAPAELAVDASYVYWFELASGDTASDRILRVSKSGGAVQQVAVLPDGALATSLAVGPGDVYVAGVTGGTSVLLRVPKAGGKVQDLHAPIGPGQAIGAVSAGPDGVYFVYGETLGPWSVGRWRKGAFADIVRDLTVEPRVALGKGRLFCSDATGVLGVDPSVALPARRTE